MRKLLVTLLLLLLLVPAALAEDAPEAAPTHNAELDAELDRIFPRFSTTGAVVVAARNGEEAAEDTISNYGLVARVFENRIESKGEGNAESKGNSNVKGRMHTEVHSRKRDEDDYRRANYRLCASRLVRRDSTVSSCDILRMSRGEGIARRLGSG